MLETKHQTSFYSLFHLNLAFSSIDKEQHKQVIERCYWPLLNLAKKGIPIGLELTAYTLDCINEADPNWVSRFRALLAQGKCELVASGDSQIIGPLVPPDVSLANLKLGQEVYLKELGVQPKLAYINEQAVSAGLLDVYIDAGFEAVVVEWDNPYSHHPDWNIELLKHPQILKSARGNHIDVLWNHAIAFQKFQRYAHGELTLEDYLQYLQKRLVSGTLAFPVYGSDAEVFDFRPGRFDTETCQQSGEWKRIEALFMHLSGLSGYSWCLPTQVLETTPRSGRNLSLTSAQHPTSVKKQAKYNLTRWGLSGRNDLALNTLCFKRLSKIRASKNTEDWRELCRLWASDLRTHLTQSRYDALNLRTTNVAPPHFGIWHPQPGIHIHYDEERRRLTVNTSSTRLTLNANRGLAVESLSFASQGFDPVIGTLSHGHFDHISYGADFYSNHLIMERFKERDRVTDLNPTVFQLGEYKGNLVVYCRQALKSGDILKWYRLENERLITGIHFYDSSRPEASIRVGHITLLNCEQRAWYQTQLGGYEEEFFELTDDIDQGCPVSSIVSSSSVLGATNGTVSFGTFSKGIQVSWDPAKCAILPMLMSKKIDDQYLNRLCFSMSEADETLRAGGQLLDFELCLTPYSPSVYQPNDFENKV